MDDVGEEPQRELQRDVRAGHTAPPTAAVRVPLRARVRGGDLRGRAVQRALVLRAAARPRGLHDARVPPRARRLRQPHPPRVFLLVSAALIVRPHKLASTAAARRIRRSLSLRALQHRKVHSGGHALQYFSYGLSLNTYSYNTVHNIHICIALIVHHCPLEVIRSNILSEECGYHHLSSGASDLTHSNLISKE